MHAYEGCPISNANSCEISFIIAIFQNSLHQNNGALLILPDPITFLSESRDLRCLATIECKVNDIDTDKMGFYLCNQVPYAMHNCVKNNLITRYHNPFNT